MSLPPLAPAMHLCLCHGCGQACDITRRPQRCSRCGARLHARKANSVERTWAFLLAALVFYVPANLLPVMHTSMFGSASDSTIVGGVLEFWESGAWDIALIIFIASIGVPAVKFLALITLLVSVQRGSLWARRQRTQLYRLIEVIGYWSMLDVLVVALVAALVQLRELGTIEPRPGILFFGLVVVFTMLSAMSFEPRLIWQAPPSKEKSGDARRH
ncbi:paraquat-inducible protein A [Pseudomonas panipatensis]|uniref:paraquat-inducible protein A n=1 Tax=Pseudomonas panipatensis TaxID=428992 RepID=UPI000B189B98|nr:paraquat-inducible protein A [Pseudomonas panipatensis]